MGNLNVNVIAILNDTHIGMSQPSEAVPKGYEPESVAANLKAAIQRLLTHYLPEFVIFNGDLARSIGCENDYQAFFDELDPLSGAGIRAYLTLGNHDDRETFQKVLECRQSPMLIAGERVLGPKYAAFAPTDFANFYLVDSLSRTNAAGDATGRLGQQLREWLFEELDARPDKPAVVVTHHTPRRGGHPNHHEGGLVDTDRLWPELVRRPWVKAYFHGHVHDFLLTQSDGIWIGSLPATSYHPVGAVSKPGWTLMQLTSKDGMVLTTWEPNGTKGREERLFWRPA
jgi:Icc protein